MIRVILPKYFNLVVGDAFQLFYRSVVEAPNPYAYDILAVCEKGRNCPRYFEFMPDEEGECEHSMDSADQHSTWRDENGKLWKLETLTQKNLKFFRLDKNDASYPALGSFLTHVSDAVQKKPLKITKYANEAQTPFYNHEKGRLDFEGYKKKCGIDNVDYIYVLLGGNEIADSPLTVNLSDPSSVGELCKRIIENAKEFIDTVREAFPNVKLKIMGLIPPSQSGGMGTSYGAKLPYCDKYGYTKFMFELNILYEALCYEEGYSDFLEFVPVGAQFDSEYAYPTAEKQVNARCKQTEFIGTNGLHSTREGYRMIADAVFKNMANLD